MRTAVLYLFIYLGKPGTTHLGKGVKKVLVGALIGEAAVGNSRAALQKLSTESAHHPAALLLGTRPEEGRQGF